MAKLNDKLMNRTIKGKLTFEEGEKEDIVSTIDNAIGSVGVSGIEDIDSLVEQVDENTRDLGTKLYRHLVYSQADDVTLFIIDNSIVPITSQNLPSRVELCFSIRDHRVVGENKEFCMVVNAYVSGTNLEYRFANGNGVIEATSIDLESPLVDTITPL